MKYYQGNRSPIQACKEENGYSEAWLHHKGRNKHHYEYWYDYACVNPTPVIPYKYMVEMICDSLAAGIVYNGEKWQNDTQLKYWNRTKDRARINPKVEKMLDEVYKQVAEKGMKETVNKANLTKLYSEYCM